MTRLLRRWFRCRKGTHRDTLHVTGWVRLDFAGMRVVDDLAWPCMDCGRCDWFASADPCAAYPKSEHVA